MTWWEGRLTGFDLETTAADPLEARIVTASIPEVGGGKPADVSSWIVDPGIDIPEEAAAIHGITTEYVQQVGVFPSDAIEEIIARLTLRPEGSPIVVFNARYDLTVLDREARRYGIQPLTERGPIYVVDPLVIDKWLHRFRPGPRTLEAMSVHYRAGLDGAHDADSDALAACRIAWVLGARGRPLRKYRDELPPLEAEWETARYELPLLHAAQERWAREQAIGLAEYFARKGEPQDVETAWPVIPLVRERA